MRWPHQQWKPWKGESAATSLGGWVYPAASVAQHCMGNQQTPAHIQQHGWGVQSLLDETGALWGLQRLNGDNSGHRGAIRQEVEGPGGPGGSRISAKAQGVEGHSGNRARRIGRLPLASLREGTRQGQTGAIPEGGEGRHWGTTDQQDGR